MAHFETFVITNYFKIDFGRVTRPRFPFALCVYTYAFMTTDHGVNYTRYGVLDVLGFGHVPASDAS